MKWLCKAAKQQVRRKTRNAMDRIVRHLGMDCFSVGGWSWRTGASHSFSLMSAMADSIGGHGRCMWLASHA